MIKQEKNVRLEKQELTDLEIVSWDTGFSPLAMPPGNGPFTAGMALGDLEKMLAAVNKVEMPDLSLHKMEIGIERLEEVEYNVRPGTLSQDYVPGRTQNTHCRGGHQEGAWERRRHHQVLWQQSHPDGRRWERLSQNWAH